MRWRRARALLYLIETRTAYVISHALDAADDFPLESETRERDLAILDAYLQGRDAPIKPTIQDLEQFAPRWAALVPDSPRLRAALAHALGEKYRFVWHDVPKLRLALGLDEQAVADAHEGLYGTTLEAIYARRVDSVQWVRWSIARFGAWLDTLTPFWAAFVLTLTFNTSQAYLALPVALAGIGPLPGIAVVVGLGLVNIVTIAAMAEAVNRSGVMRSGRSYLGRLVADHLGAAGSLVLSLSVGIRYALGVLANYVGLATTLGGATGLAPAVWTPVVFLVGLYVLSRGSLHVTLALMVLLGLADLALMFVLSLLAGMFPVMLLAASRRPGELVPSVAPSLLGHPLVVGGVYLFYLLGLLAHGLVIWSDPVERASALAAGGLICAVTLVAVRRGAFRPRAVVELRYPREASAGGVLRVVADGRPLPARYAAVLEGGGEHRILSGEPLPPTETVRSFLVDLPETGARDLLVWVYREAEDGGTEPLPARVTIRTATECRELELIGERARSALAGPCQVEVALDGPGRP